MKEVYVITPKAAFRQSFIYIKDKCELILV